MIQAASSLNLWTVYDHPSDYPSCFVARRFLVPPAGGPLITSEVMLSPDVGQLRDWLRKLGLHRLERDPSDDPCIMEVWL